MLCELSFFCTAGIVLDLACSRIVRTVEPHFVAPPEVGHLLVHGWGPHLVPDLAQKSFLTRPVTYVACDGEVLHPS